jgi:hypothetical protein
MAALDLDHRPVDLEVVEILGIDGAYRRRLPGDAEVVNYSAGCLTRVVPALETGDVVELDDSPPPQAPYRPS